MKTFKKLTNHLLLLSLLASCATPNPVVRLNSKETKTTWEKGKEFTSYYKDGFIVHCAYHGATDAYLEFDIEMANTTDEDFLLSPEKIIISTDSGKWDPLINQIVYSTFPIYAVNPEVEILKNELAQSQLEADQKNLATASIAVAALALLVMVALALAVANDAKQRVITLTELAAATAGTALKINEFSQEMNNFRNELLLIVTRSWINNSFRKKNSIKTKQLGGWFTLKPELKKYWDLSIDVPMGRNNFVSYNYKVNLYYLTNSSVNHANKLLWLSIMKKGHLPFCLLVFIPGSRFDPKCPELTNSSKPIKNGDAVIFLVKIHQLIIFKLTIFRIIAVNL
ncbi:MAG TPA: hypothetical protein ENN49_07940 [Bacteroidales bacterium]|nr:hypothetical protein [Bacteroidales bacterium]